MAAETVNAYVISMLSGVFAGLLTAYISYRTVSRKIREEFKTNAELELRRTRLPVLQKLWVVLEPFSFFPGENTPDKKTLKDIQIDLTKWYYRTGGL